MYLLRAGDAFCRAFMHGIANGKDEIDAANSAFVEARTQLQTLIQADTTLSAKERAQQWLIVVDCLLSYTLNMKLLYIDRKKMAEAAKTANEKEISLIQERAQQVSETELKRVGEINNS